MARRAAGVLPPPRARVPRQAPRCPGRSSTPSRGSCTTSSTSGLGSRWSGRTGRWSGPSCRYLAGVGVRDGCGGGAPGGGWARDFPPREPPRARGRPEGTYLDGPGGVGPGHGSSERPPPRLPQKLVAPALASCAVRASSGQPFWLLLWRLRGLPEAACRVPGWGPSLSGGQAGAGCGALNALPCVPGERQNPRRGTGLAFHRLSLGHPPSRFGTSGPLP